MAGDLTGAQSDAGTGLFPALGIGAVIFALALAVGSSVPAASARAAEPAAKVALGYTLDEIRAQQERIRQEFQRDINRFRELKGEPVADSAAGTRQRL